MRLVLQVGTRWLLALSAVPSLLLGQEPRQTIHEGERVRITAKADTGIYIVRAVSGDTLTVQLPKSEALVYFRFSTLKRVEVSREPEDSHVQALKYGLIAGVGSGVLGGLVAYQEVAGQRERSSDKKQFAIGVGGAFAAIGFGAGVISGLINNGERWQRVPLPPHLSATARGNGVLALSYSF